MNGSDNAESENEPDVDYHKQISALKTEIAHARKIDPELKMHRHRVLVRDLWRNQSLQLRAIIEGWSNIENPRTLDVADIALLGDLATHTMELAKGVIPDQIEAARSTGGGKPLSWWEREQISKAIFFLHAVKSGQIGCNNPVKLVSDAFGVSKTQVRKWREAGSNITEGISSPHVNCLEESVHNAGIRYRAKGRGGMG